MIVEYHARGEPKSKI